MPPRRSMETYPLDFGQLFEQESRFVVPLFQRDYDWKNDNVQEFWDDLNKHYQDWADRRERVPYYFGSLMLVNEDESSGEYRIVDGQQRITTSMVFFIALRDFFLEVGKEDDVDDLDEIIYFKDENDEMKPRLSLNRYNNDYFKTKIIKPQPISEKTRSIGRDIRVNDKRLSECYKKFSKIILNDDESTFGSITIEDKIILLRDMYNHLLKNFEIVENIFSKKQRAYRIFESINHKGLGLGENDLVKNYLFEQIDDSTSGPESQEVIDADNKWGEIQDRLEHMDKMKVDDFLKIHLTAFFKGKTPKDKIYDKILAIVRNKERSISFLDELVDSAKILSKFKKPTLQEWNDDYEILDNLTGYNSLSDGGMFPIFLSASSNSRLGMQEMKKLIELVTKLHFRAKTVCNVNYTDIEGLVLTICENIIHKSGYSIPDIINEMVTWPKYPDNDVFEVNFKQLSFKTNVAPKARYVLREIEYSLIGGRALSSIRIVDDIQLEHIMPKVIEGDWFNYLNGRPELNSSAEIADYHKRNLGKLGNLTLLSPRSNAILQNDAYGKKLNGSGAYTGYRDDQLKITSRLVQYSEPDWFEKQIQNRQDNFFLEAVRIWDINS